MERKSGLKSIGWLEARFRKSKDSPWRLLWRKPVKNLVVNTGFAQAALCIGDGTAVVFAHGAIGTGTDAALVGDTTLQTEVDREAVSFSRITTAVANDTAQFVTTHTAPGGGWAITEYGLLNADPAGVLFNHVIFAAINLAEGNQLEMTYKVQMS